MSDENDFLSLFKYKTLTKIHGEPDYASLKKLRDEVRSNARKVTSELGGGNHGHLGICFHPPDYTLILPTPYVRQLHPGPLVILPASTARQETRLQEDHKKASALFQTTKNLDQTLKFQISIMLLSFQRLMLTITF